MTFKQPQHGNSFLIIIESSSERSIVHYLYKMDFTFNINLIAQRGQVQSTLDSSSEGEKRAGTEPIA